MPAPMVSVCMATHNGEPFLSAQLASILPQLAPTDEIIIVDDASTDRTREILHQVNDHRIRIRVLPSRVGPTRAFEIAFREALGKFVFLSDQDDLWMPDKVVRVLETFARTSALALMSDATMIGPDGKTIHESFFRFRNCRPGLLRNFYKTTYLGCCMAFRGECKDFLLPFPCPTLAHDVWIGFACELAGGLYFLAERLVSYRRHEGNFSPLRRNPWGRVAWIRLLYLVVLARATPRLLRWRFRMARAPAPPSPEQAL